MLFPGKVLLDLDCLDDVARGFLVTVVDTLIDDERHTRELPGSRFKDRDRKHHVGSGLLSLAATGNQKCTTFRLGQVVIVDVLQILFESLLKFLIPSCLSFTPSNKASTDQAFPFLLMADTELSPSFCFQSDG